MNYPGSYDLISLKIVKDITGIKPTAYDIRKIFTSLNIYESMFSNMLSGSVDLLDTNNLISSIPILGNEHLNVRFKTSYLNDSVELTFKIYKIENVKLESQKSKSYKIYFTSEETLRNYNNRISKNYIGTKDMIVKDLLSTISSKKIDIDYDLNKYEFLFPNWNPLKCINFMLNFVNINNKADFMFWENLFGFRFKSVSNIYNFDKIKHAFNTNIGTIRNQSNEYGYKQKYTPGMYEAINDLAIPNTINDLNYVMNGVYGATTYTYDILKGNPKTREYKQESADNPKNILYIHNNDKYDYNLYAERNSIISSIKGNMIFINSPGIHERTTGDLAKVNILSSEVDNRLDGQLSGKYLIVSICHNFSIDKYTQNIGLYK